METEQRIRIHQLIDYTKQDTEFPFDTHDELEDILAHYNMCMPKDPELRIIIEEEIATIADQHQTAEIVHTVQDKLGLTESMSLSHCV